MNIEQALFAVMMIAIQECSGLPRVVFKFAVSTEKEGFEEFMRTETIHGDNVGAWMMKKIIWCLQANVTTHKMLVCNSSFNQGFISV